MIRVATLSLHLLVAAAGLSVIAPRDSQAQESKADEAIRKGREGVTLYERGEWALALAAFRGADAMFHSPVLTLYTARSLRNLGKLVEAKRVYETLAREALDAGAPRPWSQAQIDGGLELSALDAEIPRLIVDAARSVSLSVDGAAVIPGEVVVLDPGEHLVELTGATGRATKKVTLRRGDGTTRVAMAPPAPPAAAPAKAAGTDGYTVLGVVLTSVGGAAIATAGVFGIVALNEASSAEAGLPESCTASRECLPKTSAIIEAEYEPAYTAAAVADGLFIGGGIAAAAGIVILLVEPGGALRIRSASTRSGSGLRLMF